MEAILLKQAYDHLLKRRQGKWISAILMIVMVLGITACQKPAPIKVGVLGTFSGSSSDLSVSGRRGAELAAQLINETGGIQKRQIELVFKDDENNPKTALAQQQAFLSEGVQLVIGPFTSGMVLAAIDYVNSNDMLQLGATISADSLSGKDDHFIRFIASTKEQAVVLAQAASAKKHQSIMVVYDERNKGFTDQLVLNYVAQIQSLLNITPEVIAYDPSKEETVKKVKDSIALKKPEAVFVVASAEECSKMAHYTVSLTNKIQLYGPLWANTQELVRKGGTDVDGMMLVGGIDDTDKSEAYTTFKQRFEDHYGESPTFASMYTYETLMALAESMKTADQIEPTAIKNELLRIGKFEGIQGSFSLDAFGDNTRAYMLFEIENGKMRKVE